MPDSQPGGTDDSRLAHAGAELRWSTGPEDLRGAFALREQVFFGEQGVPREEDIDAHDADALQLVALDPGSRRVIGTLRVVLDGDSAKVGRVAVQREWRRRGIALRMLALALAAARERGCTRVRLAAQLQAVALYERAGFAVESDPFEEAGIQHVWMGRRFETSARAVIQPEQ
jgi:predicted GNAT family N-acyltransferase